MNGGMRGKLAIWLVFGVMAGGLAHAQSGGKPYYFGQCEEKPRCFFGEDCDQKGQPTAPPATPAPRPVPPPSSTVEPEMIPIPAGRFLMGSPDSEEGRSSDEKQHWVTVSAFEIGRFEVTQGQWQAVMGTNPSHFQNGDHYPVEQVSWNDAQSYAKELSRLTGKNYRLPTEAEWEYACRGGAAEETYCGGYALERLAWYDGNSDRKTHPVGQKSPNGYGLYDMSGNVWEWTCSAYDANYGGSEQNCTNKDTDVGRVLRGGSWLNNPGYARSAIRNWYDAALRNYYNGFRLARTP